VKLTHGEREAPFYDVICAMIVVIAMPVTNAKAKAIATKIFFIQTPISQNVRIKATSTWTLGCSS
jgi:hypothetical protein